MPNQLSKSNPLRVSSLTGLPVLVLPTYNIHLSNINWNDFNRKPFYTKSVISQAYSAFKSYNLPYATGNWNTPYGAISFNNYSNAYRLSVTSNTMLSSILQITTNTVYMDDGFGIYTNINSQSAVGTTSLSGTNVLWIYEPASGQHYKGPVTSNIRLLDVGAKNGDYVDFYIAAGPTTPGTGYYYALGDVQLSYAPTVSVIAPPTNLSYYRSQDYDIPSTPLSMSNFRGAVGYDLVTLSSWNIAPTAKVPYTSVYYIYTPDNSIKSYTYKATQLSGVSANPFYISTKFAPVTGILASKNSIVSINNQSVVYAPANYIDILINVNNATYNGLPLCYLISAPRGQVTTFSLSTYIYDLSSYCSLYVSPFPSAGVFYNNTSDPNAVFTVSVSTLPLLVIPSNLLP